MSTHVCRCRVVCNDRAAPCVTVFGFGPAPAASQVAGALCKESYILRMFSRLEQPLYLPDHPFNDRLPDPVTGAG